MLKTGWARCAFFATISSAAAFEGQWNKTFTVPGRADLRIEVTDGGITVHAWDRNTIEARVTTIGWKIGPSEVRVDDRQTGDRVEIDVRVPRSHITFGHYSVRLDLQVPRELRAQIHTGDGRISANGLAGEIRLSTGDGSIEADSVDGILGAKTGDGRLRASGRWDRLDLHTRDGSVEAEARSGSKMSGSWRVETGDGSIKLRLPDKFGADLEAHTGDGKITVEFPVTVSGAVRNTEFRGKLNGGGELLTVHTGDGAIHVERI